MNILFIHRQFKLDLSWLKQNITPRLDDKNLHQYETWVERNQVIQYLRQVEANYFPERKTFW
ncbi:hypothetical protein H6G41_32700 [Tolypothrix sp. FACHB-123]|uniref:hypothetical protein n=1 Tax=Tolypothrix sp. FACHB-123 TaxID=2692868 RepID=UPI001683974E|nr:hypothetical protein [Tolypothrix sp. FACHB-123]MBD2359290.1 hypothetical protein [Tolypothrix sp. FACHB-123]